MLPKPLTDDEMVRALAALPEDKQIAFVMGLLRLAYADLINSPWMQLWVNKHAAAISSTADMETLTAQETYPEAPLSTFERHMERWRKAHNRPHRRLLRKLERWGMPMRTGMVFKRKEEGPDA